MSDSQTKRMYLPGETVPGKKVFFVSWDSVDKFVRMQAAVGPDEDILVSVHEDGFDIYTIPADNSDSE